MDSLSYLYPLVSGSFIVPLVAWIKAKLPADFPLTAPAISGILNLGIMWGLAQLFAPTMSFEAIIAYALGGQFTSQIAHSGWKTTKKLTLVGDSK